MLLVSGAMKSAKSVGPQLEVKLQEALRCSCLLHHTPLRLFVCIMGPNLQSTYLICSLELGNLCLQHMYIVYIVATATTLPAIVATTTTAIAI